MDPQWATRVTRPTRDLHVDTPARFEILSELGRGANSVVFTALDHELRSEVALKVSSSRAIEDLYWLKREFRAVRRLSHPSIATVHDITVVGGSAWLSMELIRGVDVGSALHQRAGQWPRWTTILSNLARGLIAVHEVGRIHGDVKASNVVVEDTDRAVLVDFGSTQILDRRDRREPSWLLGTFSNAAPEVMWGAEPTVASDWYAFGVLLAEALGGGPVFTGSRMEILAQKSQPLRLRDPAGVPPQLLTLCRDLVAVDPKSRPTGAEVLAVLGGTTPDVLSPLVPLRGRTFVGRAAELDALRRALTRSRDEGGWIRIRGRSGSGKTELLREIGRGLPPDALLIESRCHPRERLPLNALDGAIDELSQFLVSLSPSERRALSVPGLSALAVLFPVLSRVADLVGASDPVPSDARDARDVALRALHDLIDRLAAARPIMWVVDDAQWVDPDGAELLVALMAGASAPRMLLVVVHRVEEADRPGGLAELVTGLPSRRQLDDIGLEGLSSRELAAISDRVIGIGQDTQLAERIGAAADGSPLMAIQLSAAAQTLGSNVDPATSMELLLQQRLASLDDRQRQLLELLSLSSSPIDVRVLLQSARLDTGARPALFGLLEGCWLRGVEGESRLTVYHDRVREWIDGTMPASVRRLRHAALAETFAGLDDPPLDQIADHYRGAEQYPRAQDFGLRAAERAMGILAFDRAAELYERSLSLPGQPRPEPARTAWARALLYARRPTESARVYQELARETASAPERLTAHLDYQRHAGELLLRSGRVDEGLETMTSVLDAVDARPPRSMLVQRLAALAMRVVFMVRGPRFARRDATAVPPEQLRRLDAIWSAGTSITHFDYVPSDYLAARHLTEALRLGEPSRVAQSIGWAAAWEALPGIPWLSRHALRVVQYAKTLADETGVPYDRGYVAACECVVHYYRCAWSASIEAAERALRIFAEECQGAEWEMTVTRLYLFSVLGYVGQWERLRREVEATLVRAEGRGDRFTYAVAQLGAATFGWLAVGLDEEAERRAEDGLSFWRSSQFSISEYNYVVSKASIYLYRRQPLRALDFLDSIWPRFIGSDYRMLPLVRSDLFDLRGRAAIMAMGEGASHEDARLRSIAIQAEKALRGTRIATAPVRALGLAAGLATDEGEREARRRAHEAARVELGLAVPVSQGQSQEGFSRQPNSS